MNISVRVARRSAVIALLAAVATWHDAAAGQSSAASIPASLAPAKRGSG